MILVPAMAIRNDRIKRGLAESQCEFSAPAACRSITKAAGDESETIAKVRERDPGESVTVGVDLVGITGFHGIFRYNQV